MIQWDDIRVFIALTSSGTQKSAAKLLRVDQATVGRRIKEFESALGTKLFDKRSDGFVLTAAGNQLLAKAKEAETVIAEMERGASALDKRPKGTIRVAMPGGMANHWLIPRLRPFFQSYPDIQIDLLTGAEVINLWNREADIAIRLVEPTQKELFYRRIGNIELGFYHLKGTKVKRGTTELPFVALFDRAMSDAERKLIRTAGLTDPHYAVRTHAWTSVYHAVRSGIGYGVLPSFYNDGGELTRMEKFPTVSTPVWMVMHPDTRGSGRMKAFTEFVGRL